MTALISASHHLLRIIHIMLNVIGYPAATTVAMRCWSHLTLATMQPRSGNGLQSRHATVPRLFSFRADMGGPLAQIARSVKVDGISWPLRPKTRCPAVRSSWSARLSGGFTVPIIASLFLALSPLSVGTKSLQQTSLRCKPFPIAIQQSAPAKVLLQIACCHAMEAA